MPVFDNTCGGKLYVAVHMKGSSICGSTHEG